MMPKPGVEFGSCDEAITRYCVARNISQSMLSIVLGYEPGYLAELRYRGRISLTKEAQLFKFMFDNWPASIEVPALIADFQKYHSADSVQSWRKIYAKPTDQIDPGDEKPKRACMCCRKPFPSEGAHNRLCNMCRTQSNPFGNAGIYAGSKRSAAKHA